jgi:DNA processing protein
MNSVLSPNTQAILLLTAHLSTGKIREQLPLVTPAKYRRLAHLLFQNGLEPADFLGKRKSEVLGICSEIITENDAEQILSRGLQLSLALDYWAARSIWVTSRADQHYPKRLRTKFGNNAPAVVYGVGPISILDTGGLAIAGSRNVDDKGAVATSEIGSLAAEYGITIVSGGARGVDQTAMLSTLDAGGQVVGVLADSLASKSLDKNYRNALRDRRLVMISTNDPNSRFLAWQAMDRNKYIYAFADAGLVIATDYRKGGTWAGAVEQLEKLKFVPVYARSDGHNSKGLSALISKGAVEWPEPRSPIDFRKIFEPETPHLDAESIQQLSLPFND